MKPDLDEARVPAFGKGFRFRFDATRQAWVVLGPERLFLPDENAVEILRRIDGSRPLKTIIDDIALRFSASRDVIAADVADMVGSLADKGVLRL